MTTGPYTTETRLWDDAGMMSDEKVQPGNVFDPKLTYRKQINNLRGHTGLPPYTGEPFLCTGSAHLAREHIRCTNPIHTSVHDWVDDPTVDRTEVECRLKQLPPASVATTPASEPISNVVETERMCPRCSSNRWVRVSLDHGWTIRAQCVPCGAYHPGIIEHK